MTPAQAILGPFGDTEAAPFIHHQHRHHHHHDAHHHHHQYEQGPVATTKPAINMSTFPLLSN